MSTQATHTSNTRSGAFPTAYLVVTVQSQTPDIVLPSHLQVEFHPRTSTQLLSNPEALNHTRFELKKTQAELSKKLHLKSDGTIKKMSFKSFLGSTTSFRLFPSDKSSSQRQEKWERLVRQQVSKTMEKAPTWLETVVIPRSSLAQHNASIRLEEGSTETAPPPPYPHVRGAETWRSDSQWASSLPSNAFTQWSNQPQAHWGHGYNYGRDVAPSAVPSGYDAQGNQYPYAYPPEPPQQQPFRVYTYDQARGQETQPMVQGQEEDGSVNRFIPTRVRGSIRSINRPGIDFSTGWDQEGGTYSTWASNDVGVLPDDWEPSEPSDDGQPGRA